jgi:hypothetical protein
MTHFIATGLPSQQNRSDNVFRFKRAAFYMGLKIEVCLVVAKALHYGFFSPSFFHTISLSPAFISAQWAD